MCNAYRIGRTSKRQTGAAARVAGLLPASGNRLIRKTDRAPVIVAGGEVAEMRWGFHRPFNPAVNNARSDKLDGAMWKHAYRFRRCVIPVSAFYEWSGPKGAKRTHEFTAPGGGWLWIAGVWEEAADLGPCYSMITTASNAFMEPIHHRMPAILGESSIDSYLAGGGLEWQPTVEPLAVADAVNPLVKESPQGELF